MAEITRRGFLRLAGAAGAAGVLGCATVGAGGREGEGERFEREVDVVVVGSGASGLAAANFAAEAGARVLVLEKALLVGGTTSKSGGVYWVPNNRWLRERGVEEPREATLRAMARASYPQLFDEKVERCGLPEHEWTLLEAYYDNASAAVDALAAMGALISQPADQPFGPMPDYIDPETRDVTPRDRRLWARKPDGSFGLGDEMVRQLRAGAQQHGVAIETGQRVTTLLRNVRGEVVGVEAVARKSGAKTRIRARRGVVFGSGGYTHNRELVLGFQPGPIYGGCAVPTNEGDFVAIAGAAGAQLGNMAGAWRAELVLEQALQHPSTPDDVFMPPGDSMVLVSRTGRRVVNETSNYNERTLVHFAWDSVAHDWPNRILVMVYDQRAAELFGGRYPLPPPGTDAPYVLRGESFEALAKAVDARLAELAPRTGGFRLDPGFGAELRRTVTRFDGYAKRGVDPEFGRGAHLYDRLWHSRIWSYPNPGTRWKPGGAPNPTMHPFQAKGPYFAILLGAGTLDTNGGPVVNARAQVLDYANRPIAGLYGAGNCIASPTGRAYYGGGGTLGPALAFALLAGRGAAAEPVKELA